MVIGESTAKDAYRRLVWGPWREFLERCPPGWDYRANRALGTIAGAAAREKRAQVVANLRRAFPHRTDLEHIAVRAFASHFANQYASFAFGRIEPAISRHWLRIEGIEHLDRAARDGVGVVLIHPHMGPAQLPLAVLGAAGRAVHQVGGGEVEVEKSAAGRWASEERTRLERRMKVTLHDGTGYLRSLLRVLTKGEVVLTACDGTGGGKELGRRYVRKVLGQQMIVPVGGFYLALRSGARVHTLHTVVDPTEPRRHLSTIGAEVPVERSGKVVDVLESAADFTAAWLSLVLSRHAGDWLFWDAFQPGGLLVGGGDAP